MGKQSYSKLADYTNGKIYAIRAKDCALVYIGATVQTLDKRYGDHISNYKYNVGNGSSRVVLNHDHYIELVEDYPCNNRRELYAREAYWINRTMGAVNKQKRGDRLMPY